MKGLRSANPAFEHSPKSKRAVTSCRMPRPALRFCSHPYALRPRGRVYGLPVEPSDSASASASGFGDRAVIRDWITVSSLNVFRAIW